jgi:hypothetical protein
VNLIDSQTRAFLRYVDTQPPSTSGSTPSESPAGATQISKGTVKAQISIHFYEKVTRRASWWATKAAESEVCWEKWELNCEFLPIARNERGSPSPEKKQLRDRQGKSAQDDGESACFCVIADSSSHSKDGSYPSHHHKRSKPFPVSGIFTYPFWLMEDRYS